MIYGIKFEGERIFVHSVDLNTGLEKKLNELSGFDNARYFGFSLSPDASSVITSEVRFFGTIWLLEDFAQPQSSFFSRLWN
jgi:hypothetical protein